MQTHNEKGNVTTIKRIEITQIIPATQVPAALSSSLPPCLTV